MTVAPDEPLDNRPGGRLADQNPAAVIPRAIGGDAGAISWILERAGDADAPPLVLVMAALLARDRAQLRLAGSVADTSRDRQVVAIADAHLAGDHDLVDALARDHLVSFPDSLIVAWIASC